MKSLPESAPRRWRFPLLLLLGSALLIASFVVAGLSLPSRADDGNTRPQKSESLGEKGGRKIVVAGHVETREGVPPVLPLQPGKVAKVIAKENEEYDEGAPLYLMDDHQARFDHELAKDAAEAAEAQLDKAKKLPEKQRVAQKRVIAAKEAKRDAAQKDADDANRLRGKGVSAEKADAAQKVADAAGEEVEAEKEKLNVMEAEFDAALKLAEIDVSAKKTLLAKARWALDECTVKAPFKGKVVRLQVSVGDALPNPRQAPILYCSTAPRIIRAEVEQEFAPKARVGQKAFIKDYANDDLGTWNGQVESISDWYTHRRSNLLEPLQFNDVRTLECIIELGPNQKPLKIGQRVRVTLPLEQ
jgi:multidrug resistance efflux pump